MRVALAAAAPAGGTARTGIRLGARVPCSGEGGDSKSERANEIPGRPRVRRYIQKY